MDKDQLLSAALLAVGLIGIPVAALVFVCRATAPKPDRPPTLRETYPDEHLGI